MHHSTNQELRKVLRILHKHKHWPIRGPEIIVGSLKIKKVLTVMMVDGLGWSRQN